MPYRGYIINGYYKRSAYDKETPIGIPVSGPVQTEKDMQAGRFHYYAIIIYTPITFTNNP